MVGQAQRIPRRRSSRVLLRIPLIVGSKDLEGNDRWESVETEVISRHGALIRSQTTFNVGAPLEVIWSDKNRSARARVVWTGKGNVAGGIEIGIEFMNEDNFWEIKFPPDRWSDENSEPNRPRS